jgi:hypothetical protein
MVTTYPASVKWLHGRYECKQGVFVVININTLHVTIEKHLKHVKSLVDEDALSVINTIYETWQSGGAIEQAVQAYINTLNL